MKRRVSPPKVVRNRLPFYNWHRIGSSSDHRGAGEPPATVVENAELRDNHGKPRRIEAISPCHAVK